MNIFSYNPSNESSIVFRKQVQLWKSGDDYRSKFGLDTPPTCEKGIYSFNRAITQSTFLRRNKKKSDVTGILQKVDTMQLTDTEDADTNVPSQVLTQGDQLNQVKAQRRTRQLRQLTNS